MIERNCALTLSAYTLVKSSNGHYVLGYLSSGLGNSMEKYELVSTDSDLVLESDRIPTLMSREVPMPNRKIDGSRFTQAEIDAVWKKGVYLSGEGETEHRKDKCGAIIQYDKFGDQSSSLGWEIDHINPLSNGGTDDITNLQPLKRDNNRRKGDKYPWTVWDC